MYVLRLVCLVIVLEIMVVVVEVSVIWKKYIEYIVFFLIGIFVRKYLIFVKVFVFLFMLKFKLKLKS